MGEHRVTLIPGDGAGPSLTWAATRVIDATGVEMTYEVCDELWGDPSCPVPKHVLDSCRRTGVALAGPLATPAGSARRVDDELARRLDLYATALWALSPARPGQDAQADVDFVVVTEDSDACYGGVELLKGSREAQKAARLADEAGIGIVPSGAAVSLSPVTKAAATRVARWAFEKASASGRGTLTVAVQAGPAKSADVLFSDAAAEVAEEFAGKVGFSALSPAQAAALAVQSPRDLGVLLVPCRASEVWFGLGAGLAGGQGRAAIARCGDEAAVFSGAYGPEAAAASDAEAAPSPVALIFAAAMLLGHLGEPEAAGRVRDAVRAAVAAQAQEGLAPAGGRAADALVEDVVARLKG